jgi:hypothetical protein
MRHRTVAACLGETVPDRPIDSAFTVESHSVTVCTELQANTNETRAERSPSSALPWR